MLQGVYVNVNRGSANRTGWDGTIGRFMISNLPNKVRIMGKNCDMWRYN